MLPISNDFFKWLEQKAASAKSVVPKSHGRIKISTEIFFSITLL